MKGKDDKKQRGGLENGRSAKHKHTAAWESLLFWLSGTNKYDIKKESRI